MAASDRQLKNPSPRRDDKQGASTGKSVSVLFARKLAGTILLWGTIGLICLLALFYVSFGPAV